MFVKGSRYRNLSESSPINAAGERLRGKDLRLLAVPASRFQHTVRQGDRLDLLSFKYYGDATKWWQIADANDAALPTDLVDRTPLIVERFVLRSLEFETRFRDLVLALAPLGQVTTPVVSSFGGDTPVDPDFVETTIVVTYASSPATHQLIVDAIQAASVAFRFLSAFAWPAGPKTAEAFSFDDPQVWTEWQSVMKTMADTPGVFDLESNASDGTLHVTYNSATVQRESLLALLAANGFSLQPGSAAFPGAGMKISIPPNQIV